MKKFNPKGLKKTIMLGTLALAISVPVGVGAASAATPAGNTVTKDQLTQIASRFGIDLNGILQQIAQDQYPGVTNPSTGTGNGGWGQIVVTVPSKPAQPSTPTPAPSKPAQPSTPTTTPSKPAQPSKPTTPSQPTTPSKPSTGNNASAGTSQSEFAAQVVTLVNQERAKAGLGALNTSNATLTKMALDKAKDMYNKGYFDHNSPTYGSPFDMMKQYGINYSYAGENIAKGQRTPQEVMTAWMNSPGHRANILNPNYKTIGVAYYNGVWVQEFIA
ncbi:CAP domain-containing protein [Cohnella terricola]|uniref:SCP domain-containing protein n=1 Tax=Cohnella terricola TaxID=1289167 RepID=A0A559JMJ5_9BACL|nr:CAP domain-containing protein [Cohnella terricola]TVY01104.1 hypothetical protein FPZ45_08080 [Cohnella terricola]